MEAAVLGVPTICVNPITAGIVLELAQEYKLLCWLKSEDGLMEKVQDLLHMKGIKDIWLERKRRLWAEKVDVTKWMVDFVEEYTKGNR